MDGVACVLVGDGQQQLSFAVGVGRRCPTEVGGGGRRNVRQGIGGGEGATEGGVGGRGGVDKPAVAKPYVFDGDGVGTVGIGELEAHLGDEWREGERDTGAVGMGGLCVVGKPQFADVGHIGGGGCRGVGIWYVECIIFCRCDACVRRCIRKEAIVGCGIVPVLDGLVVDAHIIPVGGVGNGVAVHDGLCGVVTGSFISPHSECGEERLKTGGSGGSRGGCILPCAIVSAESNGCLAVVRIRYDGVVLLRGGAREEA